MYVTLIIILLGIPIQNAYFTNLDLCQAAKEKIEADLKKHPEVALLSLECYLAGFGK